MTKWRVDFHGYLSDGHMKELADAVIEYQQGGSEVGPSGEMRSGLARHEVLVEAEDEAAAQDAVRSAIGPDAEGFSEWHARPE